LGLYPRLSIHDNDVYSPIPQEYESVELLVFREGYGGGFGFLQKRRTQIWQRILPWRLGVKSRPVEFETVDLRTLGSEDFFSRHSGPLIKVVPPSFGPF
jgi:hypothetical protein